MLTGEEILGAMSCNQLQPVVASAWGGEVYVMRMTADQRDGLDLEWRKHIDETSGVGYRAFVVAWCLCDENNKPLFRDSLGDNNHDEAWNRLRTENAALVDRLFETSAKINGILPEDEDAAVNAAAKN